MIGIINYGTGNVFQVLRCLSVLNIRCRIIEESKEVASCDGLILPGVGHWSVAVTRLSERGLRDEIIEFARRGKKILGICLGMQLLFDESQEGGGQGLSLISGKVKMLKHVIPFPHMGWSEISARDDKVSLFDDVSLQTGFYFLHCYHAQPENKEDVIAICGGDTGIVAAVSSGNILGVQFHPEKSHKNGTKLLRNFCEM